MTRKILICDAFISLYDTLCLDRAKFSPRGIIGRLIYYYERFTLQLADSIITDTKAYKRFYINIYGLPEKKFDVLYLGAPSNFFVHGDEDKAASKEVTEVFYYGTGLPLHGFEVILRTAAQMKADKVHFTLVGSFEKQYRNLIDKLNLNNCTFIPWLEENELQACIRKADICLAGHFGNTEKAKRVIPGKAYQFAAMGKVMILGDNEANREIFIDGVDCVMVPMGDAVFLSKKISNLYKDKSLRQYIAKNAHRSMENFRNSINK